MREWGLLGGVEQLWGSENLSFRPGPGVSWGLVSLSFHSVTWQQPPARPGILPEGKLGRITGLPLPGFQAHCPYSSCQEPCSKRRAINSGLSRRVPLLTVPHCHLPSLSPGLGGEVREGQISGCLLWECYSRAHAAGAPPHSLSLLLSSIGP